MKLIYPDSQGREHSLELTSSMTVGRSDKADLIVDDERTSRMHFSIHLEDDVFILRDLQSRNGTFLNGSRIDAHPLKPGDQIRAGGVNFLLRGEKARGPNTVINQVREQMEDGQGYRTILREIVSDTKPKNPSSNR